MQRHTQGGTRREDHEELGRFLEDAACYLERWDLCKANEALQKAGNKATMMRGEIGLTEPPAHYALLADLVKDIQEHLDRPGRAGPLLRLPEKLGEVRYRFDHEARKHAGEITADEAGALPG
jgi:hypothetical protein